MLIYFATSNEGKVREFRAALEPLGHAVDQLKMPYPEIQADTLEEVASFGARWLGGRLERNVVLEDSGLFIDGLGGFPGVYSAYVQKTLGNEGVLRLMQGRADRSALFRSVIAIAGPELEPALFTGECRGSISDRVRGGGGFGYDPVFVPEGHARTFAEMTAQEKNSMSHRGRALAAFVTGIGRLETVK